MPAPASGPSPSVTSPSTAAPPRWPGARAGEPTPCWAGCTPTMPRVLTRSRSAAPAAVVPFLPAPPSRTRRGGLRSSAHSRDAAPSRGGSGAALDRLKLSWKKAKKLLGRADPERRQAFIEQLQDVLAGAQRDRHLVVYMDEAHIHQDADLGYGWAERGQRLWVASSSPGLSARVSFYGVYLYNEGQVRLWPFPRANGEHTIAVLQRLRAE